MISLSGCFWHPLFCIQHLFTLYNKAQMSGMTGGGKTKKETPRKRKTGVGLPRLPGLSKEGLKLHARAMLREPSFALLVVRKNLVDFVPKGLVVRWMFQVGKLVHHNVVQNSQRCH